VFEAGIARRLNVETGGQCPPLNGPTDSMSTRAGGVEVAERRNEQTVASGLAPCASRRKSPQYRTRCVSSGKELWQAPRVDDVSLHVEKG